MSSQYTGYLFTVQGTFFEKQGGRQGTSIQQFKNLKFYLPREVRYRNGFNIKKTELPGGREKVENTPAYSTSPAPDIALHYIQRYMLNDRLQELGFVGTFRTCRITKTQFANAPEGYGDLSDTDIQDMTKTELRQFCSIHELDLSLDEYPELDYARIVVETAYQEKLNPSQAGQVEIEPEIVDVEEEMQAASDQEKPKQEKKTKKAAKKKAAKKKAVKQKSDASVSIFE